MCVSDRFDFAVTKVITMPARAEASIAGKMELPKVSINGWYALTPNAVSIPTARLAIAPCQEYAGHNRPSKPTTQRPDISTAIIWVM